MKFINLWEDKQENKVVLHTREGLYKLDYLWYFVIKREDAVKYREFLKDLLRSKIVDKYENEGEKWVRVYVRYDRRRRAVDTIRSMMTTYEDDLSLWKRYLVDEDLELDLDQKILYFDIETDDLKKGIEPGEERIVSIAAINNDGEEFYYSDIRSEKKILNWFIDLMSKHHLLVGWHSEGFDLVAIKRRCDLYDLDFGCYVTDWSAKDMGGLDSVRKVGKTRARPETFNHMDLMQKIKELHYRDTELIKKVRSFGLSSVAKVILGKDKVDLKGETIYNLARKKPELLKQYNLQDVKLLKELDDKLQVTKQKLIEHWICGARINDYTSHGKIDPYALREAKKLGMRLPSKPQKGIEIERRDDDRGKLKGDYAGGYVFEPEKGLHRELDVFDFQSLYPSLIKTFNVSPDSYQGTWNGRLDQKENKILMPTNVMFSATELGVIPKIIQSLLDRRDQIRKNEMKKHVKDSEEYLNLHYRQYAFKVLANSMYGIMGASFSRYYMRELAEGITLTGQYLLKLCWKWLEDQGHHPIYGDTDSLFVSLKKEVKPEDVASQIDEFLQQHLKEKFNAREGHLHLQYEASYKRFILIAKKKYIGQTESKEVKMTGVEAKKRDTLPKAEEWQRELIDLLLNEDHIQDYYRLWAQRKYEYVFSGRLEKKDLIFQKRLSKEIEDYGGLSKAGRRLPIPRHVRVAAKIKEKQSGNLDKLNLYSAGSYIPFVILNEKDKKEGVLHADDFAGQYDKEYYWSACYDPSKRILEAVFPEYDWNSITTNIATSTFDQQTLHIQSILTSESVQERRNTISPVRIVSRKRFRKEEQNRTIQGVLFS